MDGPPGEQGRLLEDEADGLAALGFRGWDAVHEDGAGGGSQETADGAEESGLAGAAGADNGDELALPYRQVNPGEGAQAAAAVGEDVGEATNCDVCGNGQGCLYGADPH